MNSECGILSGALSLGPSCYIEIANIITFGFLGYITLLLHIYLRCSKKRKLCFERRSQLLYHDTRSILSVGLILVHLSELGELAAGGQAYLQAIVASLSWFSVQAFYYTIEVQKKAGYLLATCLLYLCCGLSRGVLLYLLLDQVNFYYLAPNIAVFSSALCYGLAFCDFATLINEIKQEKKSNQIGEHESYQHNYSTWYSRVTFFWLVPLLRSGHTSPLELQDLGKLPNDESTSSQYSTFIDTYIKIKGVRGAPSLWRCYVQCYWKKFVLSGCLKLAGDLVGMVPPLGIAVVIQYVALHTSLGRKDGYVTVNEFIHNGYVMTGIVFISALAQGSFSQASTHIVNVEGIRLKTALQALVYTKSLKISSSMKDDDSITEGKGGNTANLLTEDTYNVMSCFWIGHYVWAIPLKIAVLLYLLHQKLGISAIIGALCCIAIMTPLQFLIGKKMSDNSKFIANWCDARLRMTNEMLQGMKVLKLCCWEAPFCNRIACTRNRELKALDKDSLYWALMTFLTHTSSALITVVTLGAYYHLEGSYLSPANVFSALALFNQLTVPLFIFPITVPIIISALVSTRRLEEFLSLPESSNVIPGTHDMNVGSTPTINKSGKKSFQNMFGLGEIEEENLEGLGEEEEVQEEKGTSPERPLARGASVAIIRQASFSWGDQDKPHLFIENLSIPKSMLTLVIGRVGSGKSSLLSALLGEMKCTSGLLKWEKGVTVAYVSQQPWLLNATLRENILLGLPYSQRRFNRVIAATALQRDLDYLPNKDLTEIGEKGVNLSGGQRQRIAIARALYSRANVFILDDPLSALDYHVAQHVFDIGINQLVLKHKKTVILVTHSLNLLTHAHQIVAMEGGRVQACGRLRDLEVIGGVLSTEAGRLEGDKSKTARDRWQLVRLVSRIGHHIKQQNTKLHSKNMFIPLRKRMSRSSEYYWTQDLPLPRSLDGDCDFPLQRSNTMPRHRTVARASSLQPHSSAVHLTPVTRQASSPTINQGIQRYLHHLLRNALHVIFFHPRPSTQPSTPAPMCRLAIAIKFLCDYSKAKTYTFDGIAQGGGTILKHLFYVSKKVENVEPPQTGSFKEKNLLRRLVSSSSIKSSILQENDKHPIQRMPSTCSECSDDYNMDDEDELNADWCGTNSSDERQYGKIPFSVYKTYMKACGYWAAGLYIILAASWQALRVYTDFWLSDWTDNSVSHFSEQTLHYLTVYTSLSLMAVVVSLLGNILAQYCGATARRRLHKDLLKSVLKLPIAVFELNPLGRILSRFTTDISTIDKKLAISIQRLIQFLLLCCSSILVNSIITPWFLLLAVPLCVIYYFIQKFYRCSSRELHRLDSISRTPILSHLTETLSGLEIIRAFQQQKRFTAAMFHKIDVHTNVFLIMNSANRWLGIALDYLGAVIVLLAMFVSLVCASLLPDVVTPAMVGLAINYTLLVPIYLNWVVKFISDVEMYTAAVERVSHYIRLQPEDYKLNGIVPTGWPFKGCIRFEGVTLKYLATSEIAVHNLSLCIPPGQKLGICGRTGSGKSSVVMSLFGMVPIIDGRILIDGVDILSLPLRTLRSRLSVIPQDVIMYSGTIRENLDLEDRFTDAELWEALEMAQMKDAVISQLGGLNGQVREGGINLSTGQRQLLCLARAILNRAMCLIMDEATSSLDSTTEKTLLKAAEQAFANKTVITIAHRLSTLLTCDRIIVLEAGRIVEDGKPNELLSKSMGIFSTMLRANEDNNSRKSLTQVPNLKP